MRFIARERGPHWTNEALADACEVARLSVEQAEAARLTADHLSYSEIALVLSSLSGRRVGVQAARAKAHSAEARLRAAHPALVALHHRRAREILRAIRNVRPAKVGILVYRGRLGTHDKEPVRFTSRLLGECPEDITREPGRFLKDLPALLTAAPSE